MAEYKVRVTRQAREQLREVRRYIEVSLKQYCFSPESRFMGRGSGVSAGLGMEQEIRV